MRRLALVLASLALAACGTRPVVSSAADDPATAKLLAAADAAAKSDDGEAKARRGREDNQGKAADLTWHNNQNQSEVVWVVQVSGDH